MAAPVPTVKVYHGNPMLPDVSRVLACLIEKDVKFELFDMNKGKPMRPELIKFQASRAPISGYEDERTRLFESRAICRHIVNKFADRGNKYLLGRDLLERASIEQWLKSEENSFDPPSRNLIFRLAYPIPKKALITKNERVLNKVLDVYEQRLSESRYLGGDDFSLADLSHLPNSHYLAKSREWGHLFRKRKNVWNWLEEISSRRSWKEVVVILNELGILKESPKATQKEGYRFFKYKKLEVKPPAVVSAEIQAPEMEKTHQVVFIGQPSDQPANQEIQKESRKQVQEEDLETPPSAQFPLKQFEVPRKTPPESVISKQTDTPGAKSKQEKEESTLPKLVPLKQAEVPRSTPSELVPPKQAEVPPSTPPESVSPKQTQVPGANSKQRQEESTPPKSVPPKQAEVPRNSVPEPVPPNQAEVPRSTPPESVPPKQTEVTGANSKQGQEKSTPPKSVPPKQGEAPRNTLPGSVPPKQAKVPNVSNAKSSPEGENEMKGGHENRAGQSSNAQESTESIDKPKGGSNKKTGSSTMPDK